MSEGLLDLKEYLVKRPYWKKTWQVVSGTNENITGDVVEHALFTNRELLQIGILQYSGPADGSSDACAEASVEISPPRTEEFKEFLVRLSKYMKVEKGTSWKILTSYLMYEYCGSLNNLDKFKYEMHILPMLSNIWKFYTSERMFKLKIIKTCLEFINIGTHPYAHIYGKFITEVGVRTLWNSLIKQYQFLLQEITMGDLDDETPLKLWMERNICEQVEVLHCLIIMVNYVSVTLRDFRQLLTLFKCNGFGSQTCCLEARRVVDESSLDKLKYSVFALVLCMANEFWSCSHDWTIDQQDEDNIDSDMDELVCSADIAPLPVVYTWIMMHMVLPNAAELYNNSYCSWTSKILNAKVFIFFNQMIRHRMFRDTSIVGINVRESLYHLVFITIEKFNQDDSFFNHSGALELCSELLKTKQMSEQFFQQSSTGLMLVWNTTINLFPYKFKNIAMLSEALILSNADYVVPVVNEIEHIKMYTSEIDNTSLLEEVSKQTRNVPNASNVHIIKHQHVTLARLYRESDLFQEFTEILNKALVVGSDLPAVMDKLVSGFKLLLAIFRQQPSTISKHKHYQKIIKQTINMFVRCSGENEPPMELLSVALDLLTETAKRYRNDLIPRMNNNKLLPTLFRESFRYDDMFASDSFNMGVIGSIIMAHDKLPDHHLLVISFLKFLRTCLHTNKRDYFFVELPALIYMLKVVYLNFPCWYASREAVVKNVLYHVIGIVYEMFQFTEEELRDPIKNNMHLLTLACLLDEPWSRILLQMLVISSSNIQFVMESETNWYKGQSIKHVTTIQLMLSILLQVLQNREKVDKPIKAKFFPLEHFIYSQHSNLKVIKAVANLLNHPFNSSIPNLACRLLKKFTVELETSMLASLELEPDQVRLMFLQRLRDNYESEDLKSAIIELITAGVGCQSGMTEAFFSSSSTVEIHGKQQAEQAPTTTDYTLTNTSKTVNKLNLNESVGNFMIEYLIQASTSMEKRHSPLLYKIMDLFHCLWLNQKELLIRELVNDCHFWESLCDPLFREIHFQNRLYAQIFNIISKDIHRKSGKASESLKGVLNKFLTPREGYTRVWLNYIFIENNEKATADDVHYHPSLLSAFKNLNIILVKLMADDFLDLDYKIKITKKCRLALKHNLAALEDAEKVLGCAELYLFLTSTWNNIVYLNSDELYQDVIDLLHKAAISYANLPKRMQRVILSVVVVCFRNLRSIDCEKCVASNVLIDSLISIFNHEYDALQTAFRTNQLLSFDRSTHQGYFLCFAIINELINSPNRHLKADYMIWLNQSMLFKNILACAGLLAKNMWTMSLAKDALETLIFYAHLQDSVNFIDTDIALDLWQQFLPAKEYFRPTDLGTVQLVPQSVKNWWMVYKRLLMLLNILLKKHTHFVKKEVIMFVSLHEEYIIEILQLVVTSVDFYGLDLVLITLNLIHELMQYRDFWKLDHEGSYNNVIEAVKTTLQCSATLLVRPTVLKYFIINKLNKQTIQSEAVPTRNLIRIMDMMTNIVSMTTKIVLYLSPAMYPAATDNRDYSYWQLQLDVNFGIPKWGDGQLTTGTLVCLICLYVRTLQHMALDKRTPADHSKINKLTKRLSVAQIERETSESDHANLFVTKPVYSDTVVGFIRLDYLNPFCNLSTVQNFSHSATVTVFPWHSKLNECHVTSALESVLTLLAVQVGPLLKYRTYDTLNMRYISRELTSELQIFHDFIRKKVADMYHFISKDRNCFARRSATSFMRADCDKYQMLKTAENTLTRKTKKTHIAQQTAEELQVKHVWDAGIDYIFADPKLQVQPSLELLYSRNKDLLHTGATGHETQLPKVSYKRKASSTNAPSVNTDNEIVVLPEEKPSETEEKLVEYIYINPHFNKPKSKQTSSPDSWKQPNKDQQTVQATDLTPDDYLQFLSNWFMYVLQKDNK